MRTMRRLWCAVAGHRWSDREWNTLFMCWVRHCPKCDRVTMEFIDTLDAEP